MNDLIEMPLTRISHTYQKITTFYSSGKTSIAIRSNNVGRGFIPLRPDTAGDSPSRRSALAKLDKPLPYIHKFTQWGGRLMSSSLPSIKSGTGHNHRTRHFLKTRQTSAFTLLEIMLVVIIIGGLVAAALVGLRATGTSARNKTADAVVNGSLRTALGLYEMENGNFPTTEQGLKALFEKPSSEPAPKNWRKYWEGKSLPKDPWNSDYVYVYPGVHNTDSYDLSSLGLDRKESEDDITNWAETVEKK